MVKKHLLYLIYEIKSVFRVLPRLLICTFIFSIIVLVAGICGNGMLNSRKSSPVNLSVAAIMPKGDSKVAFGFQMIQSMESMNAICSFVPTDMDTALEMMEDGEIVAIVRIPENFVDSVMNGENLPATVILPENADMETLVFGSIIDAGGHTLAYVQSGIYAVDDYLWARDLDDESDDAEDYLNDYYTKYALNRGEFFQNEEVTATGRVSTNGFYLCSGIMLLILLCALTIIDRFSNRSPALMQSLKINRLSVSYIKICEFFSVTLMFFVLFGVITVISSLTFAKELFHISPGAIIGLFITVAAVIGFIFFICCLTDSGIVSTLIIFIASALMLYICGRILPEAYLPDSVNSIAKYLPLRQWSALLDSSLMETVNLRYAGICGIQIVIFTAAGIGITLFRGRERS